MAQVIDKLDAEIIRQVTEARMEVPVDVDFDLVADAFTESDLIPQQVLNVIAALKKDPPLETKKYIGAIHRFEKLLERQRALQEELDDFDA